MFGVKLSPVNPKIMGILMKTLLASLQLSYTYLTYLQSFRASKSWSATSKSSKMRSYYSSQASSMIWVPSS